MQIDGTLDGEVYCQSTVIISSTGQVTGQIHADKIIINGVFEGQISANIIEILPQGKAQGVVYTDNLCIERGGVFFGETHAAQSSQHNLLLVEQTTEPLKVTLNEAK